jgi:hypothetical protein
LLGAGAILTFFGGGAILAVGVAAMLGFIVLGVAELLRPQMLDDRRQDRAG